MQWYYSQNGAQAGPVPQEELAAMLASGRISRNELVWTEGMPNWLPASDVPQLQASKVPGAPPLPSAASYSSNPYSPPAASIQSLPGQKITTYLWQSLVVTFLCCLPFGVPAIVYAAKVEGYLKAGDFASAQRASAKARTWCLVSFWVGLAITVLWLLLSIVGANGGSSF